VIPDGVAESVLLARQFNLPTHGADLMKKKYGASR
jgi:hypothetical protein